MNRNELAVLLTRLQALDNRQVDRAVADAWWPIVGHLAFEDALEAMHNHFRNNPDTYLKPGHIAVGARSIRDSRTRYDHTRDDRGDAPRPGNLKAMSAAWDDPDAWDEQVRAYNDQLRNAGQAHYVLDSKLDAQHDALEQADRPALPNPYRRAVQALDVPDVTEPRRSTSV